MKLYIKYSLLLLYNIPIFSASWYIDKDATGANNGTSWTDAFVSPASVTASVTAPGDTIYISGGTVSKTYTNFFTFPESGTAGNPITFKVGQDEGHNGLAILQSINPDTKKFTVIDGSRDPDFVPPTNVWDIAQITNNIGLRTINETGQGIFINGDGGENNTIRWVEVGPHGNTNEEPDLDVHGIRLLNINTMTNTLIEYCYIHNIRNDGINLNETDPNPNYWDAFTVRWCWFDLTGDDDIQTTRNGFTLTHSLLSDHWVGVYQGHPDQLQFSGQSQQYLKVINNILRNKANSLIISEFLVTEDGTIGPMIFAGNIFYNYRDWYFKAEQAYGATFDAWRENADTNVNNATWTNLYFINNTVYYQSTTPVKIGRANPATTTKSVWNLYVTNSMVRNNLLLDNSYNASGAIPLLIEGEIAVTNGLHYDKVGFPVTHNIIAGPNTRVSWGGTVYASPEALNSATTLTDNTSSMPSLVDTNNYDFRLSGNDTVAKDAGYDLSSLTNTFPELMTDLYGNLRGTGAGWDIGASEYSDTNLILHLTFSDDLTDGIATDFSGNNNHALRRGHQASPTNWPTAQAWTNPVTSTTNISAKFLQYTNDGWGFYNRSGDYMAVTNLSGGLQSMTNATVALWVRRYKAPDLDSDGLIEWTEDQGRYLSGGFGYSGAWTVGMFSDTGQQRSFVRVYTNNSALADTYTAFGNGSTVVTSGNLIEGEFTNTTKYVHFAFTWDNGELKTYLNGAAQATNTLPITELTMRGPAGSLTTGWLGIGVDTHNGNPYLTPNDDSGEQYPNHAWFTGEMDDIRIYNRTLSAGEVESIYSGVSPEPPPSLPSTRRIRAINARVTGTIRIP